MWSWFRRRVGIECRNWPFGVLTQHLLFSVFEGSVATRAQIAELSPLLLHGSNTKQFKKFVEHGIKRHFFYFDTQIPEIYTSKDFSKSSWKMHDMKKSWISKLFCTIIDLTFSFVFTSMFETPSFIV